MSKYLMILNISRSRALLRHGYQEISLPRIQRALTALACFFALSDPALSDVWSEAEMERCFAHQSEKHEAKVILWFRGDLVVGVGFGNVSAATGETWSYASVLEGARNEGALNLSRDTIVDGDRQSEDVVWHTAWGRLDTGEIEYQANNCMSVRAEFESRKLAEMLGVEPAEVALGSPLSFALSRQTHLTGFKTHELAFATPTDGIARAEFTSTEFYTIILASAPRCALTENDHQAAQQRFENHKVFMDRFNCDDDVPDTISYIGVSPEIGFIAVHAGAHHQAAEDLLTEIELWGIYPGANIRKMQAVLNNP